MLFHNQRQFHNRPINNVLSKPLLHKKGKEWVVISLSALTLGAFGAITNLNANASTVPNNKSTNTTKVTFKNINQEPTTPQNVQSQASNLHQRIVNNNAKYQHSSVMPLTTNNYTPQTRTSYTRKPQTTATTNKKAYLHRKPASQVTVFQSKKAQNLDASKPTINHNKNINYVTKLLRKPFNKDNYINKAQQEAKPYYVNKSSSKDKLLNNQNIIKKLPSDLKNAKITESQLRKLHSPKLQLNQKIAAQQRNLSKTISTVNPRKHRTALFGDNQTNPDYINVIYFTNYNRLIPRYVAGQSSIISTYRFNNSPGTKVYLRGDLDSSYVQSGMNKGRNAGLDYIVPSNIKSDEYLHYSNSNLYVPVIPRSTPLTINFVNKDNNLISQQQLSDVHGNTIAMNDIGEPASKFNLDNSTVERMLPGYELSDPSITNQWNYGTTQNVHVKKIVSENNNHNITVNYLSNGKSIKSMSFPDARDSTGNHDLIQPTQIANEITTWGNENLGQQVASSDNISASIEDAPGLISQGAGAYYKANKDIIINVNMKPSIMKASVYYYNQKNKHYLKSDTFYGNAGTSFILNPHLPNGYHILHSDIRLTYNNKAYDIYLLPNRASTTIQYKMNGQGKPIASDTLYGNSSMAKAASDTSVNINSDYHPNLPDNDHVNTSTNVPFDNGTHIIDVSMNSIPTTTNSVIFINKNNNQQIGNTITANGNVGENYTVQSSQVSNNNYHLANDGTQSFSLEKGKTYYVNVLPNQMTDTIEFNGDSDADTKQIGAYGSKGSVSAPKGYHFYNGDKQENFTFNGGIHIFNVNKNDVTDHIIFNGDPAANTTKSGQLGANSSIPAPNGYHFINGSTGNFTFNGSSHTFNVAQNTLTDTVKFSYNGKIINFKDNKGNMINSLQETGPTNHTIDINAPKGYHYVNSNDGIVKFDDQTHILKVVKNTVADTINFNYKGKTISSTQKTGSINSDTTINPPQSYHYLNSSEGTIIFDGKTYTFDVDKNNVTDTIKFNGDPVANTTRNGYPGTQENIPAPVHFHYIKGSNGQFNLNGTTHTFDVAKNPAHEKLVFNGDSDANHTVNGNSDSDGHVNAPNGYHYTNGNGNFKFNNGTASFNVAGNNASVKFHPILNFYKGGQLVKSITNLDTVVHGKVGQEVNYPEKPQNFINNDLNGFLTNAYSLRASDVDANIQYRLTPNDQSGNNQKDFTLNYDLNQYYTNETSPKIPSNIIINGGNNEANDKINFVYNGKTVGNTTLIGQPNTRVDVNAITPPAHYFIEPSQQFKYDNQTHNVLVYPKDHAHTTMPVDIHNDAELRKLNIGQTGTYNGHTVTKLSPNFTHWRHLRGIKPYIIHSTFNSVSNPNDSRLARITPKMRKTYYITNVYREMFGHVHGYRYEINYNGKPAYITGNPSYTENSYYDENADYNGRTATIVQPVFEYKNINTTWAGTLHPGKKVTLKGIKNISHNPSSLMTRFQLSNGDWISANKNRVQLN